MATWKKLIVSGADISQLNNDSNYVINNDMDTIVSLTGSFSGSFQGNITADSVEFSNVLNKPALVSSSAQITISYPDLTNIPADIISGAAQVKTNLPAGTISASSQVDFGVANGVVPSGDGSGGFNNSGIATATNVIYIGKDRLAFAASQDGDGAIDANSRDSSGENTLSISAVTNEATTNGIFITDSTTAGESTIIISAEDGVGITGSLTVNNVLSIPGFTNVSESLASISASAADSVSDFTELTNVPAGLVSSSAQVDYTQITNVPGDIISSSAQVKANLPAGAVTSSNQIVAALPAGTISSSAQIDALSNQDGVVSSSQQISDLGFISSSVAVVSSSAQISYAGITNVPSNIVSSSTQTIANLPAGTISGSDQVVAALPGGTISSSAQIDSLFNQDGVISSSAQIDALGFISASTAVVSSSSQIDFTQITNTGGIVSSSTQVVAALPAGTVSGSDQVAAFLPTDVVSSSAQISYTGITNVPAGIVSASAVGAGSNQGEVVLIQNGVSGSAQSIGLGTTDGVQFSSLTLTGDGVVQGNLTVQGDFTNLNTTNLNVEDKYMLLNSGSASGDSGIIFGGADGVANSGTAIVFDTSYNGNDGRLAVVNTLASDASTDQTPNYYLAGAFVGTEAAAATAQTDHQGNIRIEGEDIYIYS